MNKTYLVGYYGMQNSGDDALLAATAMGAKHYLGSDAFVVNTPTTVNIPNIGEYKPMLSEPQRFMAQNRLQQYWAAATTNNVIFGGGSVLQNQRDIDLKRDLLTLTGRSNNYALGVGIGPFKNTKAEKSCAHFLNSCDFVGVRDESSLDIAHTIAPWANVELTFDLAPSLLKNVPKHTSNREGIAVCLCPVERLKGDSSAEQTRYREIANALATLHQLTNQSISFVDFNGHAIYGDRVVHQEVSALLGDVPHRFVAYDSNPFNVMRELASKQIIISMRLHASVFGFLTDTPVFSLNYHPKCLGWCEQIGMSKALYLPMNDLNATDLITQITRGLERGFDEPRMSPLNAYHLSMNNWSKANESISIKDICRHSFV